LAGTRDAFPVPVLGSWPCGLKWCSWCLVLPCLGCSDLAGLDGHDCASYGTNSSTTAVSYHILAWVKASLFEVTKSWGFLTSGSDLTWLGYYLISDHFFDFRDGFLLCFLGDTEGLLVVVVFGLLACNDLGGPCGSCFIKQSLGYLLGSNFVVPGGDCFHK